MKLSILGISSSAFAYGDAREPDSQTAPLHLISFMGLEIV
ncbi:hypothetical protein BRLA_c021510 [Brevibacillus laterosporus LMG 15441]|uniref:Uncharacterized protein n=1 Tax=Brevibacillus laterosporus LMG 15441 TaxID=1042163 RepID=A0A075R1K4_BRELA|nr:hypothetical protein BRLA_c021510 [Brevibacillus laterosporus LMG 15441]